MFAPAAEPPVLDLQAALRRQVEGLRPGEVPLGEAAGLWLAFDGVERLASAAKALLAGRVDESRVWAREGDRSAADYLARVSGSSRGASRGLLETCKKLHKAPNTETMLRCGELSRAQAEAIADAVAVNPATEDDLLAAASHESLAELRERCARAKAAGDPDPEARHRRIHRDRRLRQYTDAEGAWNAVVRGTPDAGATFNTALQPIIDGLFQQARREGRFERRETYAFDALIELARRAHQRHHDNDTDDNDLDDDADDNEIEDDDLDDNDLDSTGQHQQGQDDDDRAGEEPGNADQHHTHGHDAETSSNDVGPDTGRRGATSPAAAARRSKRRRSKKKRSRRTNPKHLALIRVDSEALRRGRVEGDELCEITGVGPVPVGVARGLLGDSILKLVITQGVDVANVTNLGRGPTAAQRIAALWTSPYCTNQGCPNVLNIQHDHRKPWAQVHETVLGNLDRLCGACHYLKTHRGWALVDGKGRRPLVPPDDPRHPANRPSPAATVGPRVPQGAGASPQGSQAAPSAAQQQPSADPAESLRRDPTLFDNAA